MSSELVNICFAYYSILISVKLIEEDAHDIEIIIAEVIELLRVMIILTKLLNVLDDVADSKVPEAKLPVKIIVVFDED